MSNIEDNCRQQQLLPTARRAATDAAGWSTTLQVLQLSGIPLPHEAIIRIWALSQPLALTLVLSLPGDLELITRFKRAFGSVVCEDVASILNTELNSLDHQVIA